MTEELDGIPDSLIDAYGKLAALFVSLTKTGGIFNRWTATVYDEPLFFVAEKKFFTKRGALSFIEATVMEHADEFWKK